MVEGALGEADHLGPDADPPLVERLDGDGVPASRFAQHVGGGDAAVVEEQLARAAGADAQLVLLLADLEAGRPPVDDERGDAAVAGLGVGVGEHDEDLGLVAVRDPELAPVEDVVAAVAGGPRRHAERVAPRAGLREGVGPDGAGREPRKDPPGQVLGAPAVEGVDDQRVLDVYDDGHRGVDPRQLLDGDHREEEVPAGPAEGLRDLDAHDAEVEQLVDQRAGHLRPLVHLADQRRHLGFRERADVALQQALLF